MSRVRHLGIEEIRFTGGEPLLRKGIVELIGRVGRPSPRPEISLTTNGIGFARRAAGLRRGRPVPDQHLARLTRSGHLPAARPAGTG